MQTINIPIYRAKKIDSDEWVEGYYRPYVWKNSKTRHMMYSDCWSDEPKEIDQNTLAIYFDKKDKNKKEVFFSLMDNGCGGDLVSYGANTYYAIYNKMKDKLEFVSIDDELQRLNTMANVKVIGIRKGE